MNKVTQSNLTNASPSSKVEVEAIMAQVREKVQQNRQAALAQGFQPRYFVFDDYPQEPITGDYDHELYAHLRQVNQPHKILGMRRVMRTSFLSKLPLLGLVWQRIQREGHDLVIFYVNSFGGEIVTFQRHVAGVLNRLVGWSQATESEIALLKKEIKDLRERVELLEAKK
jgi:hypothetical protein